MLYIVNEQPVNGLWPCKSTKFYFPNLERTRNIVLRMTVLLKKKNNNQNRGSNFV